MLCLGEREGGGAHRDNVEEEDKLIMQGYYLSMACMFLRAARGTPDMYALSKRSFVITAI